jgi:hypothetical protein
MAISLIMSDCVPSFTMQTTSAGNVLIVLLERAFFCHNLKCFSGKIIEKMAHNNNFDPPQKIKILKTQCGTKQFLLSTKFLTKQKTQHLL